MRLHKKFKLLCLSLILVVAFVLSGYSAILAGSNETDPQKATIISKTMEYLKQKKVRASDEKLQVIANSVYDESREYDLDYRLVLAVMKVESNFKQDAVSRDGARGLLQIKPSLAKHVSRDAGVTIKGAKCLNEPEKNIKIGVNHLSWLMEKFETLGSALHAYNAGTKKAEVKTARLGVYETHFTKKVMKEYREISAMLPAVEE
jgi:soluble lytic murein transglycosylase